MRVVFDGRYISNQYHGIGRHAFNILEALTRIDSDGSYDVIVHPSYQNDRFDLGALSSRKNVAIREVDIPLYGHREQVMLPRLLAELGADVFHTPYVVVPLLASVPSIMTVHDLIFERYPAYMPKRWMRLAYLALMQAGTRRARAVLAVSQATADDIRRFYPHAAGRTRVIGGATDRSFRPITDIAHQRAVRQQYELPERYLLAVGVARPHKNLERLVQAVALLDAATTPPLVIAGDNDDRFGDGLARRIDAEGVSSRVRRIGAVEEADLAAVYSMADLFVFPSLVEGFGLPPLEAMACGTPVAASRIPAVSEVVGDAALLFDPHRPDDIAASIDRALRDEPLRRALSARGLQRAGELTWDRVAVAALDTYAHAARLPKTRHTPLVTRA